MIPVTDDVAISEDELSFVASRSSGPGGQNVNKVSTRVTVVFAVTRSPSLSAEQQLRICERLATRISAAGLLRVSSQRERSQAANRDAALARLVELLREALAEQPPRRPTRVPTAVRRRRVEAKKQHGARKRERTERFSPEE